MDLLILRKIYKEKEKHFACVAPIQGKISKFLDLWFRQLL